MKCTIREIPDGTLDYPRPSILPAGGSAELEAAYPDPVTVPYRPLLVECAGRRVLLDTGAGPLAPTTGKLLSSLEAAGVAAESIDLIALTHAHADHIGGLLDGAGHLAFPNARIVVARREYEFWRRSGIRERLGSGDVYGDPMIESVIGQWFDRYLAALEPRLELVEGEAEVSPGIYMIPAPGHTPGHCAVIVEDVLFTGDAFTLSEHVAHPEWTSGFDLDHDQTVATRRMLMERAVARDMRVVHYHVNGIGRVARRGSGYIWESEPLRISA